MVDQVTNLTKFESLSFTGNVDVFYLYMFEEYKSERFLQNSFFWWIYDQFCAQDDFYQNKRIFITFSLPIRSQHYLSQSEPYRYTLYVVTLSLFPCQTIKHMIAKIS